MLKQTIIAGLLVVALAAWPLAVAQESEPTVNESDFDTTAPPADDAYLNETESEYAAADNSSTQTSEPEPTLAESDFDMSGPGASDESYLDEAEAQYVDSAAGSPGSPSANTPGLALPVALIGIAGLALALGRGRRS